MAESSHHGCPNCAKLKAETAALKARLADVEAKLAKAAKNSSTSSKPPSSDFTVPPKKRRQPGKRRPGGQPGHPRHERPEFPPEEVDHFPDCAHEACPDCGGRLERSAAEPYVIQQVDLAEKPLIVTEHIAVAQWCERCQKTRHRPFPPTVAKGGLVGPRLTALAAHMKGRRHASFSTIREDFNGLLGCDYFSACRNYMRLNQNAILQFCLAHLIRDVKFLATHPDSRNRRYGRRLQDDLTLLFSVIHRRDSYASKAHFQRALPLACRNLSASGRAVTSAREAANIRQRILDHGENFITFLSQPGIEPTNNLAEQAIRFVAIHRRVTQGSRGEKGQRRLERIFTVIAARQQQGRSVYTHLREAIDAYLNHAPAPSLKPVPDTS